MELVKVKFLKAGEPSGRDYTYRAEMDLQVGDLVELPRAAHIAEDTPRSIGVVTKIDITEDEIESFKDKVKFIIGKVDRKEDMNE